MCSSLLRRKLYDAIIASTTLRCGGRCLLAPCNIGCGLNEDGYISYSIYFQQSICVKHIDSQIILLIAILLQNVYYVQNTGDASNVQLFIWGDVLSYSLHLLVSACCMVLK